MHHLQKYAIKTVDYTQLANNPGASTSILVDIDVHDWLLLSDSTLLDTTG
jgi:hypothetical protein